MKTSPSLALRATLAVVLMVGFYLLALGIAGGLLYIPYAEVAYAHRIHPKIALICIFGGGAILWAVFPRIDKFPPPGPKLTPEEHPQLFKELETVAHAAQQAMPAEVYLVPDVNAWVAQRGGVMGFGSRRVMGLGLPLMRALTCSQFRAVLAHEFGHYHGGDTKVGPWIYKTRGAIGRTIGSLGDSLLQKPFLWYGNLFLRITHAISRRQEFVADDMAARTIGAKPLADGLRRIHAVAPAFNAYWYNECAPVLAAGYRPPLAEGFLKFVEASTIANTLQEQLDAELKEGKTDPYDTHPPLKERLAAVEHLPPGEVMLNDPPASQLLNNLVTLESQLLLAVADPDKVAKLKSITWDQVARQVYVPQWTDLVKTNAKALGGLTPEALPQLSGKLKEWGMRLRTPNNQTPDNDHAEGFAGHVIGSALTVLLLSRGGTPLADLGAAATVTMGVTTVEPFGIMRALAEGKVTETAWLEQCRELGILGANLGQVATTS